jgi:hypothetical protein
MGLLGLTLVVGFSPAVQAQTWIPTDVSGYLQVTNIKERSQLRKRAKPRVQYDITSQITITNRSDKIVSAPIRTMVNIIGAGCMDKIWTRVFSKIVEHDVSAEQGVKQLAPGESFTLNLSFDKQANIQVSYEVYTTGVVEAESSP